MSDLEDNDDEVSVTVNRGRRSKSTDEASEPVQNTETHIPLFPEVDKDARHVVAKIDVYKLTMPNEGFRGSVPPNSSLEAIGRRFGDGRYNLHAVTQDNKILRRRNDIPIAVNVGDGQRPQQPPQDMSLLAFQAQQHEKDAERVLSLARDSTTQNREMTKEHLAMVKTQYETQSNRDREFFQSQSKQQQDFFAGVLAFTQSSFQQLMTLQTQQFHQTITLMEQGHQRAIQYSDPTTLLALFRSGIETGQGLGEKDEGTFVNALKVGLGGLQEIRQIATARQNARLPPPGPSTLPQGPSVGSAPASAPASNPVRRAAQPASDSNGSDPNIIQKLVKLKATLEAKGYDMEAYLDDVQRHLETVPAASETEDDEGEHEPSEDESEPGEPTRPG